MVQKFRNLRVVSSHINAQHSWTSCSTTILTPSFEYIAEKYKVQQCNYQDFVPRVTAKGGVRALQHDHTPSDQSNAKGKSPVRKLKTRVDYAIKTCFDLQVWMIQDLLLQEAVSRPASQGQSVLFYGIGKERLDFIGVRPLQESGTSTTPLPSSRTRRSASHFDDAAIA
ncbi:hypothetical protein CF319_g8181 [Tilletia indica]|uniref:Uncharacterized protein n=1 Tax=Tilletia indica TaxID=43049 RepID=A0A177T6H5_9BASI|nr:hypothetical protein CF319_g8181 [Tilletia indica]KAE8248799.1 hypothetical protein A4X13_0g5469 [Tilletia indica]